MAALLIAGCGSNSSSTSTTTQHKTAASFAAQFPTSRLLIICRAETNTGPRLAQVAATKGILRSDLAPQMLKQGISPSKVARLILARC